MARISDLTIRAVLDTAGVTRGVQEVARDLQRVQQIAAPEVAGISTQQVVQQATDAAESAGRAFTSTLAASIQGDANQVTAAAEGVLSDASAASTDAIQTAATEISAAASAITEAHEEITTASTASVTALQRSSQTQAEVARDVALATAAYQRGAIGLDDYRVAIGFAREQADLLRVAGGSGLASDISKAEMSIVDATIAAREYADAVRSAAEASGDAFAEGWTLEGAVVEAQARDMARASVAAAEQQFQVDMVRIKEAQIRGLLSPAEAADRGRRAATAYNQAVASAIDQGNAAAAFRGREGREALAQIGGSIKNVGEVSSTASAGIGRLNLTMASLLRQATGTHPAVAQLANVIGSFALGSAVMVGVLAGLAAIAVAWNRITKESREAAKKMEEARTYLQRLQEQQHIEDLGPGGAAMKELKEMLPLLKEATDRVRALQKQMKIPASELGVIGLSPEMVARALAQAETGLGDLQDKARAAMRDYAREWEEESRKRQRLLEEERRKVEALVRAQQQMGDILREAAVTTPFGLFDSGSLTGELDEAYHKAEALRTRMRALADAVSGLRAAGGAIPEGVASLMARLTEALEAADAEVEQRVDGLTRSFEQLLTLDITPKVNMLPIKVPLILDPHSLEALDRQFQHARGRAMLEFARGVIDQNEMEQQGREAADRFNAGLVQRIQSLLADGKLDMAMELALQLKIEVPRDAFNDTIDAIRNITIGFRSLADALGETSQALAGMFRALDLVATGATQIRAGREAGGAMGAMAQVGGWASIVAGAVSLIQGVFAARSASRQREAEREEAERRMARAVEDSIRSLKQWSETLDDTRFDTLIQDRTDAAASAFETALAAAITPNFSGDTARAAESARGIMRWYADLPADEMFATLEKFLRNYGLWTEAVADVVEQWRADMKMIEELRQQEISSRMDDIEVRALAAQGRSKEADQLRLSIQHAKELDEARKLGFSAEQLARLEEVQGMERAALAANEFAEALRGVPQGFRILNLELTRFNATQAETAETRKPPPPPPPAPPPPPPEPEPEPETGGRREPRRRDPEAPNVEDNRSYTFNVAQQPGETSEEFARRVVRIVREMDRDDALVDGRVPTGRGTTWRT